MVAGRPFLEHLFDQLGCWGIKDIVICTGYLGSQIRSQFGGAYRSAALRYSQESRPLGTAGALRLALPLFQSDTVLVLNGDSFCSVHMKQFHEWHFLRESQATLLLVRNADTKRYGRVQTDSNGRITRFDEKGQNTWSGLINAGMYLIHRSLLLRIPEGATVSLEQDVFPSWIGGEFYGYETAGPFLDIGTPESYARAEEFFG